MVLHVAVGVVVNAEQQILIAQRPHDSDHGGLWEFPGGKAERGEAIYKALCRELKEEVDLEIVTATPLIKIPYDYEPYAVLLDTWIVNEYRGEAKGVEGQVVRWVDLSELNNYKMPEANQEIFKPLITTICGSN